MCSCVCGFWRRAIAPVRAALLVVLALVAAAVFMPAAHAVVLRLRGGTVDRAITVGRAVDTVLLDGVRITNGVSVVFDVATMPPGALRIDVRNCVCDGGSQMYVRGHVGEPARDRSLEVSVSGLSGRYCSLVFLHNLPAHTNVTVRDSTIVTPGPMHYPQLSGLTEAVASPLVLYATSLFQTQLRMSNSVLRSSHAGGCAVYVGGGVELLSSAVVLDGVSLEALGGPSACAMRVAPSSRLSLRDHSVFSVTNALVVSRGDGFVLGVHLELSDSVLRFVAVEGSVVSSLVRCDGGTIGAGGWLDLYDVWAVGEASSVASLSGVTLGGGAVSIARCAATGATLVSGLAITSGAVSVQCNRAGGRVLRSSGDYLSAGLPSVRVVPCDGCAAALACFGALTASFSDCACICRDGGVGEACLPFDVPLAKVGGGGAEGCVSGVTLTESVTVGRGRAAACFDTVVFSGPVTVVVDLRSMDAFADALNVTLRHCVLAGGAQLRIGGLSESTARLMPHALVNMTNVTSAEGTVVLHGAMPPNSNVLLANSTLRATVEGSLYVPTTRGHENSRYGPALVLDSVRLLSTQLVMTRLTLVCGGSPCTAILVERGLVVNLSSAFYMDNCAVRSRTHVMHGLASDLLVSGGSVFSVQNSSWSAPGVEYHDGACVFRDVAVTGGSVLQIVSSRFRLGFAMLMATTLTVTGGSWLVHRDNDFRTAYIVFVANGDDGGAAFCDGSVWSILDNNFTHGSYSLTIVHVTNRWSLSSDSRPTIYGMCNELAGSPVTDYENDLNIGTPVIVLDCGACTLDAVCFAARVSGISGCECVCAAGGHGDACLPAAVPDGLGPLIPSDADNTEVYCVHGGSMDSVDYPDPGVRGLCFVNVTFTAAVLLDLSRFDTPHETLNITLLQCVFMGLSIRGSGARVHVNVTSSMLDFGALELRGDFGTNSQVLVAGCTLVTMSSVAFYFPVFPFRANSTLLLLGNHIEGSGYALYFPSTLVVNGGGIVMKGNTLRATNKDGVESAIYVDALNLRNGGYFDVENNTMSAVNGVFFFGESNVDSLGLLRVADCTFFGDTEYFDSALVCLSGGSVILEDGAQWRVEDNNVTAASVFLVQDLYELAVSGSGTTAVFAHNLQADDRYAFAAVVPANTVVTPPARFVVGCNLRGDEEVSYGDVFPKDVVLLGCGTCDDDAACYMPGTESVDNSSCSCRCKDGWHGASCLPVEVPDVAVPPVPERVVDDDTSCVVNQTLTSVTLDMWKTHHCYAGVTFRGVDAVLTFQFSLMPLHLPINITLTGCTFRGGAALLFVGDDDVADSAGVLIRVSRTVLRSSVVAFMHALPQHCDIAVTEVDAVQSSLVHLLDIVLNTLSVVMLDDVLLSASTLLVSNVKARASGQGAFGLYSTGGRLTLVDGSSLYVRYCSFDGYTHLFYVDTLIARYHSVFALLNNTMASGISFLYQCQDFTVSDHSVLRVVGNSGFVAYAIYTDDLWTVQHSSWLDWRDNDVGMGVMFHYVSSNAFVIVDSSSAVTLTGCKMGSTGLSGSLLLHAEVGYGFVAGCLTVAGRVVTTAAELELNGITNVTTVVACGEYTKDGDCFAPLTTAVSDCRCVCAAGGHGDACVPAPVPAGPLPPPLPPAPSPPPVGECISDMVYPEIAQAVGSGLSWLCYRNVTFSGDGMSLTVLVGAMAGDVVNVTFDECTWQDGAVLLLAGEVHAAVGSLNIAVTGNTFHDALLSVEGMFPPHTNITISENRFTVTRLISRPGLFTDLPSCVAMNELAVTNDSAVVLSGNAFQAVTAPSSAINVVRSALSVSWHSLFAVLGNRFNMAGDDGTLIDIQGSSQSSSLKVLNDSAVVIRGNVVSRPLRYLICFSSALRVESRSAVVLEGNDVQGSSVVFFAGSSAHIYYNSWLQLSGNLCRVSPVDAFAVLEPAVNLRDSTVSVSGNQFMSNVVAPIALWMPFDPLYLTNGVIVAACNRVNGGEEGALYSIPSVYNASILTCSDPCVLATSCFPAYTTTASGDGCVCTCAEGGHGDACLPVAVPEASHNDGADSCVRDVRVDEEVNAGAGTSVVCYVGVTFAADVVVDVGSMSGAVRNVTLVDCTFVGGASLYVVGWLIDPPADQRADVLIRGLVSRSGGGVVVANRYPPGSRVTVVDSVLFAGERVAYRSAYGPGGASACLVVYNVDLTGSVLTIARTHVAAVFGDAVGVLVIGGLLLQSRGALYVDGLLVQTALGLCVSVEGGVAASGGSVVAFVDSDFLLCKHAVSVRGAVRVSGSAVLLMRSNFVSTEDYAVAFSSTVSLTDGSMLLAKGNVHDGVSREMVYAAGAVTAAGGTLSFVRNRAVLPRMLSVSLSLGAGAHLRVACNGAGGRVLSTVDEYAAAGFGDAGSIDVVGCDACDRDTHCYAPGTASARMRDGACVCECGSGGYGEACVPVGAPALPPAGNFATGVFVLDNVTVRSAFVVPVGANEVTLRDVVLDGVSPVLYVPWMARAGVRIVVQNVSLLNGAVLYVMGGAGAAGDEGGPVELSVCDLESLNGVLVVTGAFPAGSALTVTDSLLVSTRPRPLVYLPGSRSSPYAPVLVLSGVRLVRSVLIVSGVALVTVMTGGRAVVVEGAALELVGGGVALDGVVFGGDIALYASARVAASGGAVLRVSGGQVHAAHGLVFDHGVVANASAVVVNGNTGALTDGALLVLRGSASFASRSWLSVRDNSVSGRLLSVPSYPRSVDLAQSTLTLHGNTGTGPVVMDGTVALGGAGRKFVVGCLTLNGRALLPLDYRSAGIIGEFRPVACGVCDADVSCFAAATRAVSGSCRCRCAEGGYGRDCLPVYLPHVDGCNRTPAEPLLSPTATLTETRSLTSTLTETRSSTLTPTPTLTPSPSVTSYSPTHYWPTGTRQVTETAALPRTLTPTASVSSTMRWSDVACPPLAVTTAGGGWLTQNDIRGGGGAIPTRLIVALPPPFRWARDPRLGAHLSFEPGPTAQPSGFGGPWGAMLRNATWVRNATNPSTVLELAVPVYGGYFIGVDETIIIRCDAVAVSGGCRGVLLGSLTIRSCTPPAVASVLSALTGVVAGAAAVGVVVTGGLGSMLEVQAVGVLAKMSCASAQERASTAALPYFLSVFAALDPLWMVVGNALLAAVFGCVHYGVTTAFQRWRGVDAASAWAATRFPSVTYTVAHAMHLGIFFGSVFALAEPGARVQHYVVGVGGALYGVAFPAGVCYLIARHTGASFNKYWQFSRKPLHERLLYPVGYWYPAAQQRMYGGMLTNMKGNYVYWCVFQLSVLCVVGVIAAVRPPAGSCHVLYFCMAAVLLAGACVVAFTDMMRSAFLTVMHTASFVLLAALCLVSAANRLTPSGGGARAYLVTVLLLTVVLLAITVYGAVVWYVEDRHWQELREPHRGGLEALLNDDDESDEDAQKRHDRTSSPCSLGTTGASSYHAPGQRRLLTSDVQSDFFSLLDRASSARCD